MDYNFKIKFKKSSSAYYDTALSSARKFENIVLAESNKDYNVVEVPYEELIKKTSYFNTLWDIVKGWKGTEIFLNDTELDPKLLSQINTVINCNVNYTTTVIQEKYCNIDGDKEGWSCKLLTSIDRYIYNGQNYNNYYYQSKNKWYEFGKFCSQFIWEIDKNKIKELLNREVNLKQLALCPVFDNKKMIEIVDNLPENINLENSDFWEIKYEENIDGNIMEKKPIGIKPKGTDKSLNGISMRVSLGKELIEEKNETKNEELDNRFIPKITYDDIGGIDGILQRIREVIEIPLKNPKLFEHLGIKPHRGVLLYGPPGCGKTLIAKAIANQIKAHFISIKGPELISKWHGQSEENLRNIFDEARKLQPSIIFFDELDSIAQRRSSDESLRFDSRFVNQLLTLMDGMEDYGNVRIIATTNRVELIDEALLRPGRFDYHIQVNKPNKSGCLKILEIQTSNMPIEPGFDISYFSTKLIGCTGAEIAFVAREAAYNCLRRKLNTKMSNREYQFDDLDLSTFIVNEEDFLLSLQLLTKT